MTVKVVGHQWYWSYEYSDFSRISGYSKVLGGANLTKTFEETQVLLLILY